MGGGAFDDDWQRFRQPIRGDRSTSLVFYAHGSLVLCRNLVEQERKIHKLQDGLLEAVLQRWQNGEVVPLFVSEGTWTQKVASIQNSYCSAFEIFEPITVLPVIFAPCRWSE